jgi:FMN-dependent NADH-azoreductase
MEEPKQISLLEIWNLDTQQLDEILSHVGMANAVGSTEETKLLVAKEYKKRGQLSDGYLLDLPNSSKIILQYGLEELLYNYKIRTNLSPFFDDLNLATEVSQYYHSPKYLYASADHHIKVISLITHKVVRTIAVPNYKEFYIVGSYGGLLYLKNLIRIHGVVEMTTVTISTPAIYTATKYKIDDFYMYKHFICQRLLDYKSWNIIDLAKKVARSFGFHHTHQYVIGKYIYSNSDGILCDIETGQTFNYILCRSPPAAIIGDAILSKHGDIFSFNDPQVNYKLEPTGGDHTIIYSGSASNELLDGKLWLIAAFFKQMPAKILTLNPETLKPISVEYQSRWLADVLTDLIIDQDHQQVIFCVNHKHITFLSTDSETDQITVEHLISIFVV